MTYKPKVVFFHSTKNMEITIKEQTAADLREIDNILQPLVRESNLIGRNYNRDRLKKRIQSLLKDLFSLTSTRPVEVKIQEVIFGQQAITAFDVAKVMAITLYQNRESAEFKAEVDLIVLKIKNFIRAVFEDKKLTKDKLKINAGTLGSKIFQSVNLVLALRGRKDMTTTGGEIKPTVGQKLMMEVMEDIFSAS